MTHGFNGEDKNPIVSEVRSVTSEVASSSLVHPAIKTRGQESFLAPDFLLSGSEKHKIGLFLGLFGLTPQG